MTAVVEFTPRHLEKAIDVARNIATFGLLEFGSNIRMRIVDPGKVVHMDLILVPTTTKVEAFFTFGVNLQMFYKILKSLRSDEPIEIEVDSSIMKINQLQHFHTIVSQDVPLVPLDAVVYTGPKVNLPTKLLQKYIRALGNIAPVLELHYAPSSDTLFLESVNSLYRTLFSIDTGVNPNAGADEYRKQFIIKFIDSAVNPSLSDTIDLIFGDVLMLGYTKDDLNVIITVAAYTEG